MNKNKMDMWIRHLCVLLVMSVGTEEIRTVPGNQTTLDLRDLTVGVSYGVSVTALVGENEGDPVTVYIKPGESSRDIMCCCVLYWTFRNNFFCTCVFPFICPFQNLES